MRECGLRVHRLEYPFNTGLTHLAALTATGSKDYNGVLCFRKALTGECRKRAFVNQTISGPNIKHRAIGGAAEFLDWFMP